MSLLFWSYQCLVSVLKSLVDWEKSQRDSKKQTSGIQSLEDDALARGSTVPDTSKNEDVPSQFEKAKAHKSTMEAAISEVIDERSFCFYPISKILEQQISCNMYIFFRGSCVYSVISTINNKI